MRVNGFFAVNHWILTGLGLRRPGMADFSKQLDWIGDQHTRMIDLVETWSKINSGSYHLKGIERMGEAAAEAFKGLGGNMEKLEPFHATRVNEKGEAEKVRYGPVYCFSKRPKANRRVLLTGHLDTVFPADHAFQRPVFLDKNTLNGPGVADMKGGIIVMMIALEALERSQWAENLGYEVLLNSDEEIGSMGSTPIFVERAPHFDFGMTFEPAYDDGSLAGERKGSGNFTVVARGKTAHAGRHFEQGVNAIHGMSRFLVDLFALNGKKKGLTVNPAVIDGGTAPNIVPDLAIMTLNVRVQDSAQQTWFEKQFNDLLAKHNSAGHVRFESYGHFTRPPKTLSPANLKLFEVLKSCGKQIGTEVKWVPSGGCCDGNNLAAAGLPNIDTLGVRGGMIHTAEEYAYVDSFTERARLSALLLLNYAAGNFSLEG